MAQHDSMSVEVPSEERSKPTLQPFKGLVSPGIAFSSGHTIWLFKFDETPTPYREYSIIWVESPTGDVTMYADPVSAIEYSRAYHTLDATIGASIEWVTADFDRIEAVMEAEDGTTLEISTTLEHSLSTQIMQTLANGVPRTLQRSWAGARVSSFLLNLLMGANGLSLRGTTETGTRYWGKANHLRTVDEASATLGGVDLGKQVPGTSTHDFGDVKTARDPYVVFGALHLEYPAPRQSV